MTTDLQTFRADEAAIRAGGGAKAIERQHEKGRLTARERIARLVDTGPLPYGRGSSGEVRSPGAGGSSGFDPHRDEIAGFQELGLWAAHNMYAEHGGAPAAGVVTGIGVIHGRRHMIIANDATVKAGAFFPMTCKKIIRAQHVARMAGLPLIYLVDSAGVYLPLQEDVFPDTDDFGRIFYLNSRLSAEGISQISAIMGFCVAGGGYLPVLCDTLLMTEGSGLYLAGQALVKAAIGQEVSDEELGGAAMHAAISGTIDFREPDDEACLVRVREVLGKRGGGVDAHNETRAQARVFEAPVDVSGESSVGTQLEHPGSRPGLVHPVRDGSDLPSIFTDKPGEQYDVHDILACVVDSRTAPNAEGHESLEPDFDEYKAEYGKSLCCAYAKIGGHAVGIVANQGKLTDRSLPGGKAGPSKSTNMPRVIYDDSADKAARFIMDCNQRRIPLVFMHDTTGFMVGRDSEQGGIIRSGAKLVNAMSNSVVPKIVVITGASYGAGNYAMCGRAFEPFISLAWPGSRCAVMGAAQASGVLAMIEERSRQRKGEEIDPETHEAILDAVRASYNEQQDIRHGAARGWVDRLIEPARTREELIGALEAAGQGWDWSRGFRTGVLQT
ncbi:MAG: acyl-CoA carboxylase subunit beta [Phycisphaeraceae bacterium]|nr:MAG: acyl-CoA carboxylase subunit beta [Phycisphaeraceae bacterium]